MTLPDESGKIQWPALLEPCWADPHMTPEMVEYRQYGIAFTDKMTYDLQKARDLPDAPLLMDLAKNEEERGILKLLSASTTIGRPIFTTPGVPEDRVKALRAGFDKMLADPAFLAEARKENFDITAVSGENLQKIVAEIVATPKSVADRLQQIIGGIEENTGR